MTYPIDLDRDTNGAGLVYFANYVAFMDRAERESMRTNSRRPFSEAEVTGRVMQQRRVAYYGNASTSDTIRTRIRLFHHEQDQSRVAFRYEMRREQDDRLICLSEAVKVLCRTNSGRSWRQSNGPGWRQLPSS